MARNFTYNKISFFFFSLFLFLGFLQFWRSRFEISTDFMAYSDIADAYLKRDWRYALNSSWPPLYSWLLTIPISLANSAEQETIYCHFLQYIFYIFSLFLIWIIIPKLSHYGKFNSLNSKPTLHEISFISITWLVSGLLLLGFGPMVLLTPDALQVPIMLIIMYLIIHIINNNLSLWVSLSLAVAVSIGFYAKSIFLPLSLLIFGVSILTPKSFQLSKLKHFLFMYAIFILLTFPFIVAISQQQGRLTFGDSGKINYGLFVSKSINRMSSKNLTKENLLITADTYPYHYPSMVDRAVWENPQYIKFKFKDILTSFIVNLEKFIKNKQLTLIIIPLIGVLFFWKATTIYFDLLLALPALAALAMYLLVWIEVRYTTMWVIWIALIVLVRIFQPHVSQKQFIIKSTVLSLLFILSIIGLVKKFFVGGFNTDYMLSEFNIASNVNYEKMKNLCVIDCKPGQKSVGPGRMYWVRYSPCKVRAQYAFGENFNTLSAREINAIYTKLKSENIDTIVFIAPPTMHQDWAHLGNDYYLKFL